MKQKVCKNNLELPYLKPSKETKKKLIEAEVKAWDKIDETVLNNLIETMDHRLQHVIDAQGWYTKY